MTDASFQARARRASRPSRRTRRRTCARPSPPIPKRFEHFLRRRRRPAARLVEMRGRRRRPWTLLEKLARGRRSRRHAATRCSPARRSTSPKTAPCCTRRCATAPARRVMRRRPGRDAGRARRARRHGRLCRRRPLRQRCTGATGKKITDVVNIGIGGSDLGPAMATLALAPYHDGPRAHFVSNVDGAHIADTLKGLDPETTLFIIASKTFTTIETMTNAADGARWIAEALGEEAVGAAFRRRLDRARQGRRLRHRSRPRLRLLGLGRRPLFALVGDRPADHDRHRRRRISASSSPARMRWTSISARRRCAKNLPVLLGLVGFWHRVVCGYPARAVIPYDQRLSRLPAYLQQLDMESNGKGVTLDGTPVDDADRPAGLGRARHQRPARLLPAAAPGHRHHPGRVPGRRRRPRAGPAATTTTCCSPTAWRSRKR